MRPRHTAPKDKVVPAPCLPRNASQNAALSVLPAPAEGGSDATRALLGDYATPARFATPMRTPARTPAIGGQERLMREAQNLVQLQVGAGFGWGAGGRGLLAAAPAVLPCSIPGSPGGAAAGPARRAAGGWVVQVGQQGLCWQAGSAKGEPWNLLHVRAGVPSCALRASLPGAQMGKTPLLGGENPDLHPSGEAPTLLRWRPPSRRASGIAREEAQGL